jgi:hypothetical protein
LVKNGLPSTCPSSVDEPNANTKTVAIKTRLKVRIYNPFKSKLKIGTNVALAPTLVSGCFQRIFFFTQPEKNFKSGKHVSKRIGRFKWP